MTGACASTSGRDRDVHGLADQNLRIVAFLKELLAFLQSCTNLRTRRSQQATGKTAIFRIEFADTAVCLDESSRVSHKLQAHGLQFIEVFSVSDRLRCLSDKLFDCVLI